MHSEDIISNLQLCFKWQWQLKFIPARHSCSLYVHGCVLPHMIKCYEFWPCITRQMKTIKKTFQISCCQYSQLTEITDIIILNEILTLNRYPELKECVIMQILFPTLTLCNEICKPLGKGMKTFWLLSASITPICQKETETRITNTTKISHDQQ